MIRSFVSPPTYLQGPDTVDELGSKASEFGETALLVTDDTVAAVVGDLVDRSFSSSSSTVQFAIFDGECTEAEIDRLATVAREASADVVVGMGGGKVIDAAKGVRGRIGGRLITVPTVASTDAPTSGLSVLYTDDGNVAGGIVHDARPDLVLVDTRVIAAAPTRWFLSGIGDALATRFEAEATAASGGWTFAGGQPSQAGLALARHCYDVLRAYAMDAADAVREGTVTDAVEATVEAIVLLSGLGFENGGLATAHAVHDGIASAATVSATHGEKVCFGLLTQLALEERPEQEIRDIAQFAHDLGLPVTTAALGLSPEHLEPVAQATCAEGTSIDNQPGDPTADDLYDALVAADALGRELSSNA